MQRHRYKQRTFSVHSLLVSLLHEGKSITFEWLPAFSGIKGNEAASTATKDDHESGIIVHLFWWHQMALP